MTGTYLILYGSTFAIFLALDYIGLSYLIKPTFERFIPDLLLDSPRLGPALLFYAFYAVGLLWFVSIPALSGDKSLLWVFGSAAFLGAIGYGTYEFTSLAVMKGWSWTMVATDLTWGTLLTATSATAGVAITRAFS
ncbi:DUF2177 family protein [Litoreibacter arenae]|uniref:Transmembrane protein n=1 Tax=Litoreibacter arenae DSM 19593 TaxID=1123360 RepID=S9S267_9RHOB|nr:DUF2177 family protein [Litoreibacter arenae]EPX80309.1 hypothetical protein thalar_01649 [Litoreibacter arenae DSM 19593]